MMGRSSSTRRARLLVCVCIVLSMGIAVAVIGGPAPVRAGPFLDLGHSPLVMTHWASHVIEVVRGPIDIAVPGSDLASFGVESNVIGESTGVNIDVVSLGDGGSILLYFESGISDGPGDDFAVFENGFLDLEGLFAELAFVEVSTDGFEFAQFDSEALNAFPVSGGDFLDPTDYVGFAGRHELGLGTGFDLSDLATDLLVLSGAVDLSDIRFVRLTDVIGDGSTADGGGNPIYDPYTTPFPTGGFDLEAIGVIHAPEPRWIVGLGIGVLGLRFAMGASRSRKRGEKQLCESRDTGLGHSVH